ncbi:DNA-directed RNA polymerase [Lithospermum erythrorhizon]|uniref:DNA-directed RNA polymerase n=1 Tax=Lithospermum erythrorhizon TaxID=34254 RepID=A0AAV3RZZ2_LITER
MADMDLDLDVDLKSQRPARAPTTSRYLPRGSKPPRPIKKEKIEVSMDVDVKEEIKVEEMKPEIDEDVDDVINEIDEDVDVDVVVNEIDVYFSPSIDENTKLHVWQFPLRPMWRPYELEERCKEVRVKPDSGEVEIDLTIDVDSDQNYDHNADPRIKINKQTLSSSWIPPARTVYAIGILSGNKLHLNPVHAVVQLRPSLEHIKPVKPLETVQKNAGSTKGEGIVKVEEPKNERLPGSSAKQSKMHRESTEQAKDGQEWLPLQYYGPTSPISASCLHKMLKKEDANIPFLMSPHDYINTLCPGTSNNNVKDRGPSIRSLRSLPLDERFKVWFREGDAVNRFDTLRHLALEESDEEILRVIVKYARLVQGNFIAKSSLVYGKDIGPDVVARDNVLAKFRKNIVFSFSQLPQRPDLKKATKDVLKVFARPSDSDWKFNTPRDMTFLKAHPRIEEQQEEAWIKLEEQIDNILSKSRSRSTPKPNVS